MSFRTEPLPGVNTFRFVDMTCDGCNIALPTVCEDTDTQLQPDDALVIYVLRLVGGYGMAIDPGAEETRSLIKIFCKTCVQKLCEQWPTIAEVVQQNACSNIGHYCSKERRFVWRPLSGCCTTYCGSCGRFGSLHKGLANPCDIYARWIVDCKCGWLGPARWQWELGDNASAIAVALSEKDNTDA